MKLVKNFWSKAKKEFWWARILNEPLPTVLIHSESCISSQFALHILLLKNYVPRSWTKSSQEYIPFSKDSTHYPRSPQVIAGEHPHIYFHWAHCGQACIKHSPHTACIIHLAIYTINLVFRKLNNLPKVRLKMTTWTRTSLCLDSRSLAVPPQSMQYNVMNFASPGSATPCFGTTTLFCCGRAPWATPSAGRPPEPHAWLETFLQT